MIPQNSKPTGYFFDELTRCFPVVFSHICPNLFQIFFGGSSDFDYRHYYRIQEKELPHRTREAGGRNLAQGGAQPQPWVCGPESIAARATGGSCRPRRGLAPIPHRLHRADALGYMLSPAAQAAFGITFS